jgi:arylsulfatase A-like enzyme
VDVALGEVLKALERAGIVRESVLIITADHGGHAKTHGSRTPQDMNTPWIAWGINVRYVIWVKHLLERGWLVLE